MKPRKRRPVKSPPTTPSGIKLSRPNVRLDTQTILPLLDKPIDAQELSKATQYPIERIHRAMMWAIEHGKVTTSIVFREGRWWHRKKGLTTVGPLPNQDATSAVESSGIETSNRMGQSLHGPLFASASKREMEGSTVETVFLDGSKWS